MNTEENNNYTDLIMDDTQINTIHIPLSHAKSIGLPRKERAWLLRESNIFRVLQNSDFVQLLEKRVHISHSNYITFVLTGITMACFDANNIGKISFDILTPDIWKGMWVAFTLASMFHYIYRLIDIFRITNSIFSNDYSVIDHFTSKLDQECDTFKINKEPKNH